MTAVNSLATSAPLVALGSNAASNPADVKASSQIDANGKNVGAEFESVLISMLISNMRKSSFGEGLFPGDKSDTLGGLFDMMIAGQISESGGIGVQDLVNDWLSTRNSE